MEPSKDELNAYVNALIDIARKLAILIEGGKAAGNAEAVAGLEIAYRLVCTDIGVCEVKRNTLGY